MHLTQPERDLMVHIISGVSQLKTWMQVSSEPATTQFFLGTNLAALTGSLLTWISKISKTITM